MLRTVVVTYYFTTGISNSSKGNPINELQGEDKENFLHLNYITICDSLFTEFLNHKLSAPRDIKVLQNKFGRFVHTGENRKTVRVATSAIPSSRNPAGAPFHFIRISQCYR